MSAESPELLPEQLRLIIAMMKLKHPELDADFAKAEEIARSIESDFVKNVHAICVPK